MTPHPNGDGDKVEMAVVDDRLRVAGCLYIEAVQDLDSAAQVEKLRDVTVIDISDPVSYTHLTLPTNREV